MGRLFTLLAAFVSAVIVIAVTFAQSQRQSRRESGEPSMNRDLPPSRLPLPTPG